MSDRLAELLAAIKPKPWVAQLHPAQRAAAVSKARFKAVTTSRRGGKTVGLVAEDAEKLEECQRGDTVLYIAKTRDTARELAWGMFQALNEEYKLGWEFRLGDLCIENKRGGKLLLRGAEGSDAEKERQKIRGLRIRHASLDEAQSYASSIKRLLRETIEPALGDLRGSCTVAGTPGEVMAGGWYNISHKHDGCEDKWERFHWTVRENTFFRDAEAYLAAALRENRWTVDHPTYQREYEGRWAADPSVQVYRYLAARDDVSVVDVYSLDWPHGLGVDFGEDDACAWTLSTSRPYENTIFEMLSFKVRGLKPAECADITGYLVGKTRPDVLVGDGGNLGGNIYIDAINERLQDRTRQRMVSAQKTEKNAYIRLFNGDIESGRVKFCKGPLLWLLEDQDAPDVLREAAKNGCEPHTSEMETLPWANEARLREHGGYDNHCCDSGLYNWRHFSTYLGPTEEPGRKDKLPGESGYESYLEQLEIERFNEGRKGWMHH